MEKYVKGLCAFFWQFEATVDWSRADLATCATGPARRWKVEFNKTKRSNPIPMRHAVQ